MPSMPAREWPEFVYPLWVVVDSEVASRDGATNATHMLVGEGDVDLPLFLTEANARSYIANRPLPGHEPLSVDSASDLRIVLEVFRQRGGMYVRFNDVTGSEPGIFCPTVESTLAHLL